MTSKIKVLGLAIFAIAAMSMIAASAVQAANGELHVTNTGGAAVDLTGEQTATGQGNFKLTTSGLEIHCTEAKDEGTVQNEGTSQTQTTATEGSVTLRATGCQSTGPFKATATVKMNGCKATITGNQAQALTAQVDIAGCTTGKKIEVSTEGCTVTVGEQGPLSHITVTNEGTGETQHVTGNSTIQGIQYQTEGVLCLLGNQQHSDGDLSGQTEFKVYQEEGVILRSHNGHQYNELICGTQHGLFAT